MNFAHPVPSLKNTVTLVLFSSAQNQVRLAALAEEVGCNYVVASRVADLYHNAVVSGLYHGLIIDTDSLKKANDEEREVFRKMQQSFPILFLDSATLYRKDAKPDEFWDNQFVLSFFNAVEKFTPRPLRIEKRLPLHLPALVCKSAPKSESVLGVTDNLSLAGAFVILTTGFKGLEVGNRIDLSFVGINEQDPIRAQVRWVSPWGRVGRLPGIGVQFDGLTENQHSLLRSLVAQAEEQALACPDEEVNFG